MRLDIHWAIRDFFPVMLYHQGTSGRVILMSGLSENLRLLHLLRRQDHVICITHSDYLESEYATMRRLIHLFELDVARVSVLCNYPAQTELACAAGLHAYFCNQNAFINENIFRPRLMQKQFDAVYITRAAPMKRPWLAREIGNLAFIRGPHIEGDDYEEIETIPHRYINEGKLAPQAVVQVLSASRVGLILSEAEGACLASSEYILCGLPVVSTPSRGGRDIWYDAENSLICEPSPVEVHRAVRLMIERLQQGEIDPRAIREKHIQQARSHRERFLEVTKRAFEQVEASDDPTLVFERTFDSPGILPLYRSYAELCGTLGTNAEDGSYEVS